MTGARPRGVVEAMGKRPHFPALSGRDNTHAG